MESSPDSWKPEGWDHWGHEQRRIWRLEQQLLDFQSLAFAAFEYAHRLAVELARVGGADAPTERETSDAVHALKRQSQSEWQERWEVNEDAPHD